MDLVRFISILFLVIYVLGIQEICGKENKSETIKVVSWDPSQTKDYLFIGVFILVVGLGKLLYHKLYWVAAYIPESLVLLILGIIAGLVCKYFLEDARNFHLTPNLFFLVLLPPIVLDSAYRMYNRTFGDIFGTVLVMAVLGTVFCFLLIAFSLYGLEMVGAMGPGAHPTNDGLMALLLFSSLIVAVDPVAVLAIFKDLGVDRELYYLIFGESLLNDAVTVVLYEIMTAFIHLGPEGVEASHVLLGVASFFTVSGGGLLVGLVAGLVSSLITRAQSRSSLHVVTLVVSAYLAYLLAQTLHWSGIISLIGCGILQAAYAFRNLGPGPLGAVKGLVALASEVSEAVIFVYLGVEILMNDLVWHPLFLVWTIVVCLVSRLLVLLVIRLCVNHVAVDQRKVSWTEYLIMSYGGLRGAVAFSLVSVIEAGLLVPGDSGEDLRIRNLFVTTTLVTIFFTVGVMGTTMKPLARVLRVRTEESPTTLSLCQELNGSVVDHLMSGLEVLTRQRGRNRLRVMLAHLDSKYVRPILVNDPFDNDSFKILKRYQQVSLALHLASTSPEHQVQSLLLVDVPRTLWPNKPPSRKLSHMEIRRKLSSNLRKVSLGRVIHDQMETDPLADEDRFMSLLETAHNNRVRDMAHRKTSLGNLAPRGGYEGVQDDKPFQGRMKRAFTLFSQSNLGYIDDTLEETVVKGDEETRM